ncbi:MAG: YgaP family membrane protein [Acidimicrobiales bacterium]
MKFAQFMSSGTGRLLRIVAGIALIVIGLIAGGGWVTLSVIGLVPLIAGLANVCLLAPLFGQPLKGN